MFLLLGRQKSQIFIPVVIITLWCILAQKSDDLWAKCPPLQHPSPGGPLSTLSRQDPPCSKSGWIYLTLWRIKVRSCVAWFHHSGSPLTLRRKKPVQRKRQWYGKTLLSRRKQTVKETHLSIRILSASGNRNLTQLFLRKSGLGCVLELRTGMHTEIWEQILWFRSLSQFLSLCVIYYIPQVLLFPATT